MTYEPGLDLVVVNYKTPFDLRGFLQSLVRYPATVAHHCTVVNVCADPTDVLEAEQWLDDRPSLLTVVNTVDNVGYSGACNLGAALGRHDVIALLNADIKLTPDSLDTCYQALVDHDDWGILGPRQVDEKRRLVHAGITGTLDAPQHRGWHERDRDGNYTDILDDVPTVSGSAFFIKRTVWDELAACPTFLESCPKARGAFLLTPHYYEETYCAYHAQAHGHRCVYFGEVTVEHKWHAASPHGGWAEQQFKISREIFRDACEHHQIPHDIH